MEAPKDIIIHRKEVYDAIHGTSQPSHKKVTV
ncbi:MAG: carbon storage regulator [Planctomycetaceae bacterium]|nr:carbon storage regulator [Planctomycetaceae bacterium]